MRSLAFFSYLLSFFRHSAAEGVSTCTAFFLNPHPHRLFDDLLVHSSRSVFQNETSFSIRQSNFALRLSFNGVGHTTYIYVYIKVGSARRQKSGISLHDGWVGEQNYRLFIFLPILFRSSQKFAFFIIYLFIPFYFIFSILYFISSNFIRQLRLPDRDSTLWDSDIYLYIYSETTENDKNQKLLKIPCELFCFIFFFYLFFHQNKNFTLQKTTLFFSVKLIRTELIELTELTILSFRYSIILPTYIAQ